MLFFFLIFINLVFDRNKSTGDSKIFTHRILPAGQQHVGSPQCSILELILAQVFTASPVAGAVFRGLSVPVSLSLSVSSSVSVSSYVCGGKCPLTFSLPYVTVSFFVCVSLSLSLLVGKFVCVPVSLCDHTHFGVFLSD